MRKKIQRIDIMVDIETLSRHADAAIIRIAAVPFNLGEAPDCLYKNWLWGTKKTGEVVAIADEAPDIRAELYGSAREDYPTFDMTVNATSCAMHGMHFDQETVDWWSKNKDDVKAHYFNTNSVPVNEALDAFAAYVRNFANYGRVHLWCQGTDFDISILRTAYRNVLHVDDNHLPWSYKDVCDARTYVKQSLSLLYKDIEDLSDKELYSLIPTTTKGNAHDAMTDCYRTLECVNFCRFMQETLRNLYFHDRTVEGIEKDWEDYPGVVGNNYLTVYSGFERRCIESYFLPSDLEELNNIPLFEDRRPNK